MARNKPAKLRNSSKMVIGPILLTVVAVWLLMKLSQPVVDMRRVKAETQPIAAENKRLLTENRLLRQNLADLQTPEGVEAEAHRQGWIKPGERRLVFTTPPPAEPELKVLKKVGPKQPSLFDRIYQWSRAKALGEPAKP